MFSTDGIVFACLRTDNYPVTAVQCDAVYLAVQVPVQRELHTENAVHKQ
jgi:hypothetical protein